MIIESWVWWTLLAASMQSVRTAAQKQLSGEVSALTATLVRYLYGLPFAVAYLVYLVHDRGGALPLPGTTFFIGASIAGVLQILATVLLIKLFTLRSFAVGTTYIRSELLLTAGIGYLFFGELISFPGWIAIVTCVVGLVIISISKTGGLSSLWNTSAIYGLGSGLSFALTSLFLRDASLSFGINDAAFSAAITLVYMVTLQTIICLIWVRLQHPGEISKAVTLWKPATFVGITSVLGSVGWFTAMTLELASYVKTLGQVEFLITLSISVFYFRERPTRMELLGMVMIIAGALILLSV